MTEQSWAVAQSCVRPRSHLSRRQPCCPSALQLCLFRAFPADGVRKHLLFGRGFWAPRVWPPRVAVRPFLLFVAEPGPAVACTWSVWTHIPTSPGRHGGGGAGAGSTSVERLSCQLLAQQPRHHPRSHPRPPRLPPPCPRRRHLVPAHCWV